MAGVRVQGLAPQVTRDFLWKYFGDQKFGGGEISNLYHPLQNNDAVILFKDPSVTIDVLGRQHEKFHVVEIPHKVFSKMQVWVDKEMTALIQATDTCVQALQGQVQVGMDPDTSELTLTGETYQIEWAQMYLSQLKDNQIHIERSLQKQHEYKIRHINTSSGSGSMVNGNAGRMLPPEPVASPRLRSSHASAEVKSHGQRSSVADRLGEKNRLGSPSLGTEVKSKDTPAPRPRGSRNNTDADSTGFSPITGSPEEQDNVSAITASLQRMTVQCDTLKLSNSLEKGQRQADADNTFDQFAGSPNSSVHQHENTTDSTQHTDHASNKPRPYRWRTMPGRTDMEKAERAHLEEHRYTSLDPYGADRRSPAPFSSLQPGLDHREDEEGAGAIGGLRSLPQAALRRSLSHGASPRGSDISPFALMSNASIELSRRSFKITKNLTLKIFVEDITKARTEAVVNAANWELKHVGGVAGALARAAGPQMADECDRLVRHYGHLETGQVVKTRAYGKLSSMKYVLHTVGPMYTTSSLRNEERCVYELAQTFYNCLDFADTELHLKSLTFPFISTGIFGVPMEQCALAIVTAAQVYADRPSPSLQEIHFIHNDVDVACEAIILTDQRLQIESLESSKQRLEEGAKYYGHRVYPHCAQYGGYRSKSKYLDDDKYSSHSGSTAGTTASRTSKHLLDWNDSEPQSMPAYISQTNRPKTDASESPRGRALDDSSLSSRQGRDPSPRPAASGSRPRSSSVGNALKRGKDTKETTNKPATTRESSQRKTTPIFKPALMASGAAKTNSTGRISSSKNKGGHPVKASRGATGKTSDHSGVSDTDSTSVAESEDDDGTCPICLEPYRNPKKIPCGHTFCTQCLDQALAVKPKCPKCQRMFGIQTGTQPKDGRMTYRIDHSISLPGYGTGAIVIDYYIPGGTQEACHPNPGKCYSSINRTAYLPYNTEGKEVLKMLEKAFAHRLVFTIDDSHTTGAKGVIVWNDIHHKTSTTGGHTNYGYPDPDYLRRVKEELADKGITSS